MLDWITLTFDLGRRLSANSVFKRLVKIFLLFPSSLAVHLSTFVLKYAHSGGMKVSVNGNLKGVEGLVDIQEEM
jgi:hypothetical protein